MPWDRYYDHLQHSVLDRWINQDGSVANGEILVEKLKPGQVYKEPPPPPNPYEIYAKRDREHKATIAAQLDEINQHLLSDDSSLDPSSKRELAQSIALQRGRNS